MNYIIDTSLEWDGLFSITTDTGTSYSIKIKKMSINSDTWTMDFIRTSEQGPANEIFKTLSILMNLCDEYLLKVGANKFMAMISGDIEESKKKSKVFTRFLDKNWNCKIDNPQIEIGGLRQSFLPSTSFMIIATRKHKQLVNTESNSTISENISQQIKFCFNCGTQNNNFDFCPSCGTKLKQT